MIIATLYVPLLTWLFPHLTKTIRLCPGATVTIRGNGFTAHSEIWIHPADINTTIASYSATEIAFVVPEVFGEQNIVLKQNGLEWRLGKIYVAEEPESGGGPLTFR